MWVGDGMEWGWAYLYDLVDLDVVPLVGGGHFALSFFDAAIAVGIRVRVGEGGAVVPLVVGSCGVCL
jgi:hypothetical protein